MIRLATHGWKEHKIRPRLKIPYSPVSEAAANRILAPYGRKIGPDPASIDAAMIGGIAANNAAECAAVWQTTYKTVADIRVILPGRYSTDTADEASVRSFKESHKDLLRSLKDPADIAADKELKERIIKNIR